MALKFYASVTKRVKTNEVKGFWGLILMFVEYTREKLIAGFFTTYPEKD